MTHSIDRVAWWLDSEDEAARDRRRVAAVGEPAGHPRSIVAKRHCYLSLEGGRIDPDDQIEAVGHLGRNNCLASRDEHELRGPSCLVHA